MNRTSTEPEPRVVVIVLNWNGVQDTVQCLRSLQAVTYGNMETIVVDNGSGRSDVAELRTWTSQVTLLENPTNLGFSGGNNVAIRRALSDPRTDYVLILNNDVVVTAGWLRRQLALLEMDRAIAIVGPTTNATSGAQLVGTVLLIAVIGLLNWTKEEAVPVVKPVLEAT